jgi:uncharacterized protein YgfB (UPF0149 family)
MNYQELSHFMAVEGFIETPAELHGLLCGRLAGGEQLQGAKLHEALLESLESDEEVIDNSQAVLATLYNTTLAALQDSAFAFKPLLPDMDASLADRVEELAMWSQGFLAGLGDAGLSRADVLSDEVSDALKDIAAIAQAEFDGDVEEEDETDFMELEEYIRVAAILIFTEMGKLPIPAQAASTTIH